MARTVPEFEIKEKVIIHFTDRDDYGTITSRHWDAPSQEWQYQVRRPALIRAPSGAIESKTETTGWMAPERQLRKI